MVCLVFVLIGNQYYKNKQHYSYLLLGQVVNMVREAMTQKRQLNNLTTGVTHIRIPASYQAGITLVMCADSAAASELLHTEQLPLL